LNRLSEAKLVSKQVEGRRHEFSLTRAGEKALRDWRPSAGPPATDYDDLLRTAFLSAYLLRDATAGAEMLRQAARARSRAAEDRADQLRGRSLDLRHLDGAAYQWMRLVSEQQRLAAESKALECIAAEFEPRTKGGVKPVRRRT
jgi:DNA-binding PadR family transcriptional regulator